MKASKIFLYLLFFLTLLVIMNCSSLLYTSDIGSNNNTSEVQEFPSCGESIEYISDIYRALDTTFPIQKKIAQEYVVTKLAKIEEYFNTNIDALKEDSVRIFIEYQSDQKVRVSTLYPVSDSSRMIKEINNIFACQPLDSISVYSISIELQAVKENDRAHVFIEDINYSTVAGRSKAGVMRTVMQNIAQLRYEYNRILRQSPGVKGRLSMKFVIDEMGNIIFLKVVESTLNNCTMENNEVNIVKGWIFEPTSQKPNLTTVIYPFVFSQ